MAKITTNLPGGSGGISLLDISANLPIIYNNTSGVISSQKSSSILDGYLSFNDWNLFNEKQQQLNGNGFVKISGTTISYDNNTYALASEIPTNFIPLTGTTVGNPVTGDIVSESDIKSFSIHSDEIYTPYIEGKYFIGDEINLFPNPIIPSIIGKFSVFDDGTIKIFNAFGRGIGAEQDYSSNITALDYTQKIYVDTAISTAIGGITIPTLQQVTTVGAISTNPIQIPELQLYNDVFGDYGAISVLGSTTYFNPSTSLYPKFGISNGDLTVEQYYSLPDASGTIALTSDIPTPLGYTPENVANKQNSLTIDGTGTKYPTVDAVNAGITNSSYWTKTGDNILNNNIGNIQLQILAAKQIQILNSGGTQVGFIDENGTYRAGTATQYVTVGLLGGNTWMSMVRSQASMGMILGNPQVSQPFFYSSTNYFGTSYIAGSAEVSGVANAEHSFNIGNSVGDGITSGIFRIGRTRLQSTVPVKYATNLSGSYDNRTLVDKEYVDGLSFSTSDKQLLYNDSSTGIIVFDGLSINVDTTKFNVGAIKAWFINNYTDPLNPTKQYRSFPATTANVVPNIATQNVSYLAIDVNGVLQFSNNPFDNAIQRDYCVLGVLVHSNRVVINAINNQPVVAIDNGAQLSDLMEAIGFFNISGNVFSPNGANLNINKSYGHVFKQGSNFINTNKDPHTLSLPALISPTNIRYRLQNGTEYVNTAVVDPGFYDNAGVRTAVPGTKYTIQRIYLFQSNLIRIQYGQAIYANMADAIQAITTEAFVVEQNILENGLFRGLLILRDSTTNLLDTSKALFIEASKFGSVAGLGSLSTTNLQQAYNNSTIPLIVTNSVLDGFSVKNGTGNADNITPVYKGQNTAGTNTFQVNADGATTALSFIKTGGLSNESLMADGSVSVITSGISYITGTIILNFDTETDSVINTVLSTLITDSNIKTIMFIPKETLETSLDDFMLNGVKFNIENIIDGVSFDIRGSAINNASGNYTVKYSIGY